MSELEKILKKASDLATSDNAADALKLLEEQEDKFTTEAQFHGKKHTFTVD